MNERGRNSRYQHESRPAMPNLKPNVNIHMNNVYDDEEDDFSFGLLGNCFGGMLSMFGKSNMKHIKGKSSDNWEVPYESLKNELYLCSGAQGMVYSARLRGEIVAVKKVRSKSETNIKHLQKLNHDNIVRFYGVCVEAPNYCLIMEYCQYGSLYDFLGRASLRPKQLIKWAKDIAAGMQYLHSRKIIHRDLKSPNVLIADDLVIKVSDFGTCRTWDDVSTIMTFSGTVPWMAPEIIRQEPCTERVDVWSYGVVLWEMLTKEVPYKNMETPSILWGVGTKALSLPIPVTCPNSFQMILCQCWNQVARNRPSFKIIRAHLEMAASDITCMDAETFANRQEMWGEEARDGMVRLTIRNEQNIPNFVGQMGPDEMRDVYKKHMNRANDLYMEVVAIRLQLEEREKIVALRERQLKACRCGARKTFKIKDRKGSSSSDGRQVLTQANDSRRRRKKDAQLVVNYIDNAEGGAGRTVTLAVEDPCDCNVDNMANNVANNVVNNISKNVVNNVATNKVVTNVINNNVKPKETVVEKNGNVEIQRKEMRLNLCKIPDVAQV